MGPLRRRAYPRRHPGLQSYLKGIPGIDDIVLQYTSESLRTSDVDLLFASAVMLGAAADRLFYQVAEALALAQQDPTKKRRLEKLVSEARNLPDLRAEVKKAIDALPAKKEAPYITHPDNTASLFSLFDVIRLQRNDAVHPAICTVDRPTLYLLLASFPHVCKRACRLMDCLKANQI